MIDRFAKIIVEVKKILRARQWQLVPTRRATVEGVTLDSLSVSRSAFIIFISLSLALTATACVHAFRFSNRFFSGTISLRQKIFFLINRPRRDLYDSAKRY